MSSLRQQVAGVINTCKTVIAAGKGKELPGVDATTVSIAMAIIEQAKAEQPLDKVLAAVKLEPYISWTAVLTAMETVQGTLPPSEAKRGQAGGTWS
jgi:hypothetical protein